MSVDRRLPEPDATRPDRRRTSTEVVTRLTRGQIQALSDLLPRGLEEVFVIRVGGLPSDSPTPSVVITHRQRQILAGLARGESSKEIGCALGISPRTVDRHVLNLMRKLEVHSRYELVQRTRALISREDAV